MGRDVKRYFGDLHRFLSVGRLLFFPEEVPFGRPRPVRLARGVRQPVRGSWRWSWRGQGFVEPNRALTKAAFSGQRRYSRVCCGRTRAAWPARNPAPPLMPAERTVNNWTLFTEVESESQPRARGIRVLLELTPSRRWCCLGFGCEGTSPAEGLVRVA